MFIVPFERCISRYCVDLEPNLPQLVHPGTNHQTIFRKAESTGSYHHVSIPRLMSGFKSHQFLLPDITLHLQPPNLSGEDIFRRNWITMDQWTTIFTTLPGQKPMESGFQNHGKKFTATHHPLSILPIADGLKELLKTSCWIPPLKKTWNWKPSASLVWASPCSNQRRVHRTSSCNSFTSTCRNESPLQGNITIIEGCLQLQWITFVYLFGVNSCLNGFWEFWKISIHHV